MSKKKKRLGKRCPVCRAPEAGRHQPTCVLKAPVPLGKCPDCGGPSRYGTFNHQECCPFYASQEATAADDREWFEAHPGERVRVRPPLQSEQMENSLANPAERGSWVTHVTVRQMEPGFRVRHMHTAMLATVPR